MYGPGYHVRPVATSYMRDPNSFVGAAGAKSFDGGVYDEHLEKAARLQAADLAGAYGGAVRGPHRSSHS